MDDVEKVVKYIVVIAPGFLVLAICDYLIEWSAIEPHVYVPAAIMFSMFVYAATYYSMRFCRSLYWRFWQCGVTPPAADFHLPSFILATVALSFVVGAGFSILYVNDAFAWAIGRIDSSFRQAGLVSKQEPLQFIVSRVATSHADEIDGRPQTKSKNAMLRFQLDDGTYVEGYPMYYPRRGDGFVYLSFACFVTDVSQADRPDAKVAAAGAEKNSKPKAKGAAPLRSDTANYVLADGPGVLMQTKDAMMIEVIDYDNSRCLKLQRSAAQPKAPPQKVER